MGQREAPPLLGVAGSCSCEGDSIMRLLMGEELADTTLMLGDLVNSHEARLAVWCVMSMMWISLCAEELVDEVEHESCLLGFWNCRW
mgnify:CR=1 FL=1